MIKADLDFPSDLPMPTRQGNSVQHVQPFMRTSLANGRARQRRLFTLVPSMQKFQWIFTADEAAYFEAWFVKYAMDGSRWFNMYTRNPLGVTSPITARFSKMYDGPDIFGDCHFSITADLEVFERPLMPLEWVDDNNWWEFRSELDIIMNDTWPRYYADN